MLDQRFSTCGPRTPAGTRRTCWRYAKDLLEVREGLVGACDDTILGADVLSTSLDCDDMILGADVISTSLACDDMILGADVLSTSLACDDMILGADVLSTSLACDDRFLVLMFLVLHWLDDMILSLVFLVPHWPVMI
ncbi:hypothetical protein AVEN_44144-1 [Araneus ventricosus]|uniref:Uncharacterized protein n=1 Tax=Araneus ventricosus TaxID=182803 RepID=A0A4Y2DCZ0_ARAVE|nr:hypothetical protein AVEN_44144-1 [Araneus ventricosus]